MPVVFTDNSEKVKVELNDKVIQWLYESAGEIQAGAVRNSRVDTGQLKGSWKYFVEEDKGEATVGSELENAILEEFGTGEWAINGDGRQTPWKYKDRKGKWHTTTGKRPQRTLFNSFTPIQNKLKKRLEDILKGMN